MIDVNEVLLPPSFRKAFVHHLRQEDYVMTKAFFTKRRRTVFDKIVTKIPEDILSGALASLSYHWRPSNRDIRTWNTFALPWLVTKIKEYVSANDYSICILESTTSRQCLMPHDWERRLKLHGEQVFEVILGTHTEKDIVAKIRNAEAWVMNGFFTALPKEVSPNDWMQDSEMNEEELNALIDNTCAICTSAWDNEGYVIGYIKCGDD